jgi:hypothetical protein
MDLRAIDALVYLFDLTTKDHTGTEDLRHHKLVFRRKRRGAPKNLENHWVTYPQIAAFVDEKTPHVKLRKIAVDDAQKKFGRGRSSVFAAMARKRSSSEG